MNLKPIPFPMFILLKKHLINNGLMPELHSKKVKEDIVNKVTCIKSDLSVIGALNSEFELELYETYKSSLSIQEVILKK